MSLAEELGFYVEDGLMKTTATRESDVVGHAVPLGVRPATPQELTMYNMLVEITK